MGGFEVRLRGTNYGARADERGVAVLRDLLPGPYRAVVTTKGEVGYVTLLTFDFVAQRDSVVERQFNRRN